MSEIFNLIFTARRQKATILNLRGSLIRDAVVVGSTCMALRRVGTLHGRSKAGLSVNVSETTVAAVLQCSGQICFGEEATLLSSTARKYLNANQDIVLELSSVAAVDSAGIRELVLVHMQACAAERQVRIAAPSKELLDLLRATNVASLFEIHPTLDRALASLTSEVA